jgi:AcrR family transcriptional regulator
MRMKRKDGQETRANLLDAAAKVFADKGFRAATVVEICNVAGTNVASVNYYFGSKEELYVKAWDRSFELSVKKYPIDGGVPSDAPVEERLRGHIRAAVARSSDPESLDLDITHQEMASPTGLLQDIMHESIQPLRETTTQLVRELMGEDATEQQVELCHMSIISQCFGPLMRKSEWRGLGKEFYPCKKGNAEIDLEAVADHVFEFSLAGIRHTMASSKRKEGQS